MAKKKLERFKENLTFPNLFQLSYQEQQQGFVYKGNWPVFFGNNNPIVLELGCGKGDYTIFLAEKNKELNYIGIDIKGARLWRGCKSSLEKNMKNVAFIRTYAQMLEQYFTPGEVSEIWITFPDPQPRQARERKRLTAPRFLQIYKVILKEKGLIHLKTDNLGLFNYSLEVISGNGHHLNYATSDLYQAPDGPEDAKAVQTFYEKMFLEEGKPICYLAFTLNNTPVHHESPG